MEKETRLKVIRYGAVAGFILLLVLAFMFGYFRGAVAVATTAMQTEGMCERLTESNFTNDTCYIYPAGNYSYKIVDRNIVVSADIPAQLYERFFMYTLLGISIEEIK